MHVTTVQGYRVTDETISGFPDPFIPLIASRVTAAFTVTYT